MNTKHLHAETNRNIRVVVDDRERQFKVFKTLVTMDGVDVEVKRLPVGDYFVSNEILVERKTVVDFAHSVFSGRLFQQAYRLATDNSRSCFILEGDFGAIDRYGLPRHSFEGATITLSLVFGIPCLWSQSPDESARFLFVSGRQLARRRTKRPRFLTRKRGSRIRIQARMLEAVPGIGPDKASAVLDHFGTIKNLANTTEEALLDVRGIGPQMAKRIAWAFGD